MLSRSSSSLALRAQVRTPPSAACLPAPCRSHLGSQLGRRSLAPECWYRVLPQGRRSLLGLPCPRHRRSGKIGPRGFLTHRHVVVWPADWTVNRKLSSWVFGLNTQRFGDQGAPRHRSALAASVSRKPDPSCFPGGFQALRCRSRVFGLFCVTGPASRRRLVCRGPGNDGEAWAAARPAVAPTAQASTASKPRQRNPPSGFVFEWTLAGSRIFSLLPAFRPLGNSKLRSRIFIFFLLFILTISSTKKRPPLCPRAASRSGSQAGCQGTPGHPSELRGRL